MHKRFTQMQSDDAFVRAYMRWLGHHEFGLSHKPLIIGEQHLDGLNPDQPDYWLAYWLGTYQNICNAYNSLPLENRSRILLISHERLCKAPAQELARLFKFVKIDEEVDKHKHKLRAVENVDLNVHFDKNLTERADFLQHEFLNLFIHEH